MLVYVFSERSLISVGVLVTQGLNEIGVFFERGLNRVGILVERGLNGVGVFIERTGWVSWLNPSRGLCPRCTVQLEEQLLLHYPERPDLPFSVFF